MALPDPVNWGNLESIVSVLTTELNSLANATMSANSATQDQDAIRHNFVEFELVVTYGTAPLAGQRVLLFLLPNLDGSNFATSNIEYISHLAGIFTLDDVTTAQRIIIRNVLLPSVDFQVALYNDAGQAMAASANTLKMRRYSPTIID